MEEIEISVHCPCCKNPCEKHVLNIERDYVLGLMTAEAMKETNRLIDVILMCPEKNIPFKVTLKLSETSLSKIKKVSERRSK